MTTSTCIMMVMVIGFWVVVRIDCMVVTEMMLQFMMDLLDEQLLVDVVKDASHHATKRCTCQIHGQVVCHDAIRVL